LEQPSSQKIVKKEQLPKNYEQTSSGKIVKKNCYQHYKEFGTTKFLKDCEKEQLSKNSEQTSS
jgi:hypothetical protein